MISEHISNDIPPQMKILNMVIPVLLHNYSFLSNLSMQAARHPADIMLQVFDVIHSDVALQKQVH